jgi:hypothetical protein
MSIERLLTQDLLILPYDESGVDEYNDPQPTFGTPVAVKGYIDSGTSRNDSEENRDRETAISRWRLFLPASASLTHRDRVVNGSDVFEVDGHVEEVWNPRTRRVHHIEADLRLVDNVLEEVS